MESAQSMTGGSRVALLIASLSGGGAERVAVELFRSFQRAGLSPLLLTLDREVEAALERPSDKATPFAVTRLSSGSIESGTLAKTAHAPVQLWRLSRQLRRRRITSVLSLMERANILNLAAPGSHRRFVSIHSHPAALLASKTMAKRILIQAAYRLLLARAQRIVFVTEEAKRSFARIFPRPERQLAVIPNPCDAGYLNRLARLSPGPEAERLFERPTIVTCGRLIPDKGHGHLLRAFAQLAAEDPDVQLAVLGRGPLLPSLEQLRAELGLEGRVHLPGFQANPIAWVARAKAFVLSSLREGLPMALLEAMAVGTPVVAVDCSSGPREILAPATDPEAKTDRIEEAPYGLLTPQLGGGEVGPSRAEELLAQGMHRLLRDAALHGKLSAAAMHRVERYHPERIAGQWIELLLGSDAPRRRAPGTDASRWSSPASRPETAP